MLMVNFEAINLFVIHGAVHKKASTIQGLATLLIRLLELDLICFSSFTTGDIRRPVENKISKFCGSENCVLITVQTEPHGKFFTTAMPENSQLGKKLQRRNSLLKGLSVCQNPALLKKSYLQ